MRIIGAFFVLSALAAVPAAAQEKTFEGPSVTVITGIDDQEQIGKGQTGVIYGGQLGYNVQKGKLVLGVEGEVSGASTKNCDSFTATAPATTIHYCSKAGRDLYAGAKIGAVVGETTLLYGKVGYTNARNRFDYNDSATPANNSSGSGTSDGIRVGAGIEKAIGPNLSLKTEYRYSNYEGSYSRHQGVVGVGFRF